jgi:hypothetical protein
MLGYSPTGMRHTTQLKFKIWYKTLNQVLEGKVSLGLFQKSCLLPKAELCLSLLTVLSGSRGKKKFSLQILLSKMVKIT